VSHIYPPKPDDVPSLPPTFRTACYVVGTVFGLGVAPALAAAPVPAWSVAAAAAVSGAANALAFGYRPTR
jgi:hypothetical protein